MLALFWINSGFESLKKSFPCSEVIGKNYLIMLISRFWYAWGDNGRSTGGVCATPTVPWALYIKAIPEKTGGGEVFFEKTLASFGIFLYLCPN